MKKNYVTRINLRRFFKLGCSRRKNYTELKSFPLRKLSWCPSWSPYAWLIFQSGFELPKQHTVRLRHFFGATDRSREWLGGYLGIIAVPDSLGIISPDYFRIHARTEGWEWWEMGVPPDYTKYYRSNENIDKAVDDTLYIWCSSRRGYGSTTRARSHVSPVENAHIKLHPQFTIHLFDRIAQGVCYGEATTVKGPYRARPEYPWCTLFVRILRSFG